MMIALWLTQAWPLIILLLLLLLMLLYTGPGTRFNYPDFGGVAGSGVMSQLDWLRADLAAVDRTVTPWVIAAAHRNL